MCTRTGPGQGEGVPVRLSWSSLRVKRVETAHAAGPAHIPRRCWSGSAFEVPVDHADDDRALADGRRHPFPRPVPDVPDREHPGNTRFERERGASKGPRRTTFVAVYEVLARDDEPCFVARDLGRQPLGVGPGADMDKER